MNTEFESKVHFRNLPFEWLRFENKFFKNNDDKKCSKNSTVNKTISPQYHILSSPTIHCRSLPLNYFRKRKMKKKHWVKVKRSEDCNVCENKTFLIKSEQTVYCNFLINKFF